MGEGWGEGEIRRPLSLREAQPLMVSLSNHVAISSPATPKIPFILSIDVKTRPFPLSLDGRGLG